MVDKRTGNFDDTNSCGFLFYEWQHKPLISCSSWTPRKANHERLTLLKSVHIYKKHRVQYEIRTYFRFMQFLRLTGSTADTFLEYIQRNLPEGVAMKVTKVEITAVPSHIRTPNDPQQLALSSSVQGSNQ
jgi:ribosomal protein S10